MTAARPNFFIVGAPRCGTTAMYEYLSQHPDIFMPDVKEPAYFGQDLQKRPRPYDEAAYLALFRAAKDEHRLGEATVWYLYSKSAPAEIKAFCPDARIIIMLRNPVDMVYSLHSLMVFTGNEDITDFEEALGAEEDRRRGERMPPNVRRREGLQYLACGRYSAHVRRYLDTFGLDAVRVILYDDLRADAVAVYRETLEFLGVDRAFMPRFPIINRNKQVRSRILQQIITAPLFFRAISWLPRPISRRLRQLLKRLNMQDVSREKLDGRLRARLTRELADDVAVLAIMIGRDLSAWTATPSGFEAAE